MNCYNLSCKVPACFKQKLVVPASTLARKAMRVAALLRQRLQRRRQTHRFWKPGLIYCSISARAAADLHIWLRASQGWPKSSLAACSLLSAMIQQPCLSCPRPAPGSKRAPKYALFDFTNKSKQVLGTPGYLWR